MSDAPVALVVDCRGWRCPRPIIEIARQILTVEINATIQLIADDPATGPDLAAWCRMRGQVLVWSQPPVFVVRRAT
jgi:tRNA 2-thiouridine synthesizing protein A